MTQWKNAGLVAIQVGVDSVSAILLTVVLTHLLSPEEYGLYSYLYSLIGMVSLTLALGVKPVILREAARGNVGFVRTATLYQLRFLPLFVLVIIAMAWFFQRQVVGPTLLLIAFIAPFTYIFDSYAYVLAGRAQFQRSAWLRFVVVGVTSTASIGVVYLTRNPLAGIFAYFSTLAIARGIIFFAITRGAVPESVENREALHRSNHLSVVNILGTARLYLDRLVVGSSLGLASVSYYGIGYAYGDLLTAAGKVASNVSLPVVAKKSQEKVRAASKQYFWLLVVLVVGGAVVLSILARPLVSLVFPESYSGTIRLAQILPFVLSFKALGTFFAKIIEIRSDTKTLYRVNLTSYSLEILAVASLTPLFGLTGLIAGEAVAYLVFFVLSVRAVLF